MEIARCLALVIWGLSVVMLAALSMAAYHGKLLSRQSPHAAATLRAHRRWVRVLFWSTLAAICVIEPTFRLLKLSYPLFFWYVHLPLFLSYAVLFPLAWRYDGRTNSPSFPRRHNKFGRWTVRCGMLTALTGDWLVYVLIWLHASSAHP